MKDRVVIRTDRLGDEKAERIGADVYGRIDRHSTLGASVPAFGMQPADHTRIGVDNDRLLLGKEDHSWCGGLRLPEIFPHRIVHRDLDLPARPAVVRGELRRLPKGARRDRLSLVQSNDHMRARTPLDMEPQVMGPREPPGQPVVSWSAPTRRVPWPPLHP